MTLMIRRTCRIALALSVLTVGVAQAQFGAGAGGGELGQQTQRAMESAFDNLYNQGFTNPTSASLEELVGKEKLDAFLDNAVVKLTFLPEGAYKAYALEGGEVISFKLGKDKLTPSEDEEYVEGWLIRDGEFEVPKKAQKLSMLLKAGPTEVSVDCHNKFSKSEEPVTYYVGPLDGLFCVGLTEAEADDEEDQTG